MSVAEVKSCQIVALQGAASNVIQALLMEIAATLIARGLRVVGVVENSNSGPNPCKSMELRSFDDGRIFSISQNLGPGSQACNLHPEGIALACAAVQESISHGADVVILSKFGKQEALGSGLNDAFGAAIAAGIPIITSVSPAMMDHWRKFAGELAECVTADSANCDSWLDQWSRNIVTGQPMRDMMGSPLAGSHQYGR